MDGERIIGGLDVSTYTRAPLQLAQAAFLDAAPRYVFANVSDHAKIDYWIPLLSSVNVSRGHAATRNGVGTIRYVHYGPFMLREYIIAFDPPNLLAYSVERHGLIEDHVAVMHFQAERYGGTNLSWRHYFRLTTLPGLTTPLMRMAYGFIGGGALNNLIRFYGGQRVAP